MPPARLDFAHIDFEGAFAILTIDAGTDVGLAHFERITAAILDHFGDRPYAYISNRIHRYSVHPMAARHLIESTNVVAGALVVQNQVAKDIANAEKFFYNRPVGVFTSMEDAKAWLREQLKTAAIADDPEERTRD